MINGIHHVTAFCGDPQANVDFYAGVLGLRLVKVTINYDDPGTYHLYYGDATGSPGSLITFFPWPDSHPGKPGLGQVGVTTFSVPADSMSWWKERLASKGLTFTGPTKRLDEDVISLADPDGILIELVGGQDSRTAWHTDDVTEDVAIRGFRSVELWSARPESSEKLLTGTMGFNRIGVEENRISLATGNGAPGQIVDIISPPSVGTGRMGKGVVHHVAWGIDDDAAQSEWQDKLAGAGMAVTPVQDRNCFNSIYFREHGGVLFEIATEQPGFLIDESLEHLGEELQLPPWLEPERAKLKTLLPPFTSPHGVQFP